MPRAKTAKRIRHILCPTDLSSKSQQTVGFAARLAETLGARLTAAHCATAAWFAIENRLSPEAAALIRERMTEPILKCADHDGRALNWQATLIENSFDAATDIINLARETDVDLIVMKARPGMLSAFRFGSIVERVVSAVNCPVLLLPSRFLMEISTKAGDPTFRRILFDYDFSQATDSLFQIAMEMTRGFEADLHLLSVLQPPGKMPMEMSGSETGLRIIQAATKEKLSRILERGGKTNSYISTTVEWGDHAGTVLKYAENNQIDLICTTLSPPYFYFEKLYCAYLGQILKSAKCPILVKQAM